MRACRPAMRSSPSRCPWRRSRSPTPSRVRASSSIAPTARTSRRRRWWPSAERAGLELAMATTPITAAALAGVRVLYLRAPSTAIAPDERAAIVAFVRDGGSLLLVMDENRRQDIAVVGANDLHRALRPAPDAGHGVPAQLRRHRQGGGDPRRRSRSAVQRRTRRRGRHAVRVSARQGRQARPAVRGIEAARARRAHRRDGRGHGQPAPRRPRGPAPDRAAARRAEHASTGARTARIFMEEVLSLAGPPLTAIERSTSARSAAGSWRPR